MFVRCRLSPRHRWCNPSLQEKIRMVDCTVYEISHCKMSDEQYILPSTSPAWVSIIQLASMCNTESQISRDIDENGIHALQTMYRLSELIVSWREVSIQTEHRGAKNQASNDAFFRLVRKDCTIDSS